ncbi:MAG: AAA family ATPase [Hyphomicrobiaceae bacterium]
MSNVAYHNQLTTLDSQPGEEQFDEHVEQQYDEQFEGHYADEFAGAEGYGAEFPLDGNPERARPIPRISIQAFCDDPMTAQVVQVASEDRRLAKAHVSVHMGGVPAAIAHYHENPSPNLIVVESMMAGHELLLHLDQLAEFCDPGTKVLVIGHANDVVLYRELMRRGVSEYLVAPISPLALMECVSNLYNDPESDPVGQVIAFVGAKGGVGASTLCHNAAWMISRILQKNVVIADLDLPFGTAGLDFNQDPVQGIADALGSPERLDEVLLDRLLAKCTDHLSLFAAPGVLDRNYELSPEAYEHVLDVVRQNVPVVAVDLPHVWTTWAKQILLQADDVVVVAAPDLANLRNAKNIVDLLKQNRKNDRPPQLVMNLVGVPKRPEIPVKDFAEALGLEPCAVIEFDGETFGMAANNGQMIEEVSAKAKAADAIRSLSYVLTNRTQPKVEKKNMLEPLLKRLNRKKAGA